ncbi:hypothetical protein HRbin26_02432 [bacterium HR26]|nr:hypothetical protein HRbin26_02432 [bacterium HR26]
MNQRINVVVNRASQVHHVPQIGRPQIEPVRSTIVVNTKPSSAAERARRSQRGWRRAR